MPVLEWDKIGERVFESGLSHGVLYSPDGSGVPWNGLVSVVENFDRSSEGVYFDGMKVNDFVTLGDFSASLKAITYPDKFLECEGTQNIMAGVLLTDQIAKTFALSYRTNIGNDVATGCECYKLHLIYNVTAIPSGKEYASFSSDPVLTEFEWAITAIPEEVVGFRPTAHIIFDTRHTNPNLLEQIETRLYGGDTANADLPSFSELMDILFAFYSLEIVDNNDGTWTAKTIYEGYITMITSDEFQIDGADVVIIDADTYEISSTR